MQKRSRERERPQNGREAVLESLTLLGSVSALMKPEALARVQQQAKETANGKRRSPASRFRQEEKTGRFEQVI